MAARLSKENFDEAIRSAEVPVLVDFYSDSCIPCKQLSPVLGDVEEDYEGRLLLYKVNINFDTELAERFQVMSAPTLLLFRNGEVKGEKRGLQKKAELEAWIESFLSE